MVLNVSLIRHGKTQWNVEKKYLGLTDKPLCDTGAMELREYTAQNKYTDVDIVFSSPLKRCMQTADIIYPAVHRVYLNALRECDFGEFEGKSYEQLKENLEYKLWIDSMGNSDLHGGEPNDIFAKRCICGFNEIVETVCREEIERVGVVVHGGVIMNIMAHLCGDGNIFMWQCKNGYGFRFDYDVEECGINNILEV